MAPTTAQVNSSSPSVAWFATTHWSVVLQAKGSGSPDAAAALEKLCASYWYPLYAYARQRGHNPEDAQDLTQEFFSRLLHGDGLASVNPSKGRFRSFLLVSMKNLLNAEWRRARCEKRGGGQPVISLDAAQAEGRYQLDPPDEQAPDKVFERRWAETLLDRSLTRLRAECDGAEKARRFEELKVFLLGEKALSFSEAAARLNMSLVAVKGLAHRLRRRFGELIREEIAHTVSSPEEIEEELRHLFAALSG